MAYSNPQRLNDRHRIGNFVDLTITFLASVRLFFQSKSVQAILKIEIDHREFIYRQRYGDWILHSLAVYAFSTPERIHRFLDFTYQHMTFVDVDCTLLWRAFQAAYLDEKANATLPTFRLALSEPPRAFQLLFAFLFRHSTGKISLRRGRLIKFFVYRSPKSLSPRDPASLFGAMWKRYPMVAIYPPGWQLATSYR